MKQVRYQFFETMSRDPRLDPWEHQFFLDQATGRVYLPAVDPEIMLLALMDNDLIEVDGRPFCPLLLYVERFPQFSAGLVDFEQRVKAAV
ncbi:MAG: hypothetical protein AB1Z38_06595 [Desulfotignum sp.]